jgi:peptide/nickel transport system substrate-binding protein
MGYESAEMDSLLSAALSADKADVPAALAAINNLIVTEWVSVPYGALPEGIVIADNLEGVKQTTSTIFLFDDAYFTSGGQAAPVSALETPAQVTPACDATVPGSEIVYGPFYAGRGFDPPYSSGALVGGTELAAVYDTLIRYNPETAGFEPQLARDMTVNEDFTVWTLHLRDGITYDDGTPLDADMVVANHERFFTPTSEDRRIINTSPAFLQFIEETKVIDSLTVEYHLIQPWATFPFVLSDEPGFIININAVGDDPEAFNALPPAHAGVGAYTVEKNTPGEEIVFKARDNYWGGPVCVETLRFNMAAASALIGATGAYEAFQNGDLTTAFLRDSTAIAQAEADGAKMSMDYQDAGGIFYFNHRAESPTSDATLREAISLAIDVDVLNDRAHNGDMRVAKSVVVPGSPYYTDAVLEGATDAARAAELVAESGFSGTLRLLCGNRGPAVEIGLATEAMLEAVGLDVEINAQGTSAAIAEMIAGNYDLNCGGWNAGGATAISSYVRNLQSTSPSNRMGYESAEMDSLLSAALSADKADIPAALAAINNLIVTEWVSVPYGALPEGIVIADNLEGVKQTTSTIFLFDDAYFTE